MVTQLLPRWLIPPDWSGDIFACECVRLTMTRGRHLLRIVRRGSGSVMTWWRAQMMLLSAQGMDVPAIAKATSVIVV